jgi:hypothetical protein
MNLKDINQLKAEAELAEFVRQPKVDEGLGELWIFLGIASEGRLMKPTCLPSGYD